MDRLHRQTAARIRLLAKQRKILVTHVPDLAGVSVTHYFAILKGQSSPTLLWLEKIAKVLAVSVRDLLPAD